MEKILIIKLGADGDVLRTLPLAKAIKKERPNSLIFWVTKGDIAELIKNDLSIDKVLDIKDSIKEEFDAAYNFDIETSALELFDKIKAKRKYGFYDNSGFPAGTNPAAEYYINTSFDDQLKKSNKKTYQEMMFEIAELKYDKSPYSINLKEEDIIHADKFAKENNINKDKLVGIHVGASSRWPSKAWSEKRIKEFILLCNKNEYQVLLFGGPNEANRYSSFINDLKKDNIPVFQNNPNNSKTEFASLVSLCKIMICSDSFALHIALGLNKPTIGLFFCTSPDEVETYALLKKIISPMLKDFFPERSDQYSKELTESITAEEVLSVLQQIIK